MLSRFGPGGVPRCTTYSARWSLITLVRGRNLRDASAHPVGADDLSFQVILIDLLAFFKYTPAARTLSRLLALSPHEEVLVHGIKALAAIGGETAGPQIARFLPTRTGCCEAKRRKRWEHSEPAAQPLASARLLEDENRWVRLYAQRSLAALDHQPEAIEA